MRPKARFEGLSSLLTLAVMLGCVPEPAIEGRLQQIVAAYDDDEEEVGYLLQPRGAQPENRPAQELELIFDRAPPRLDTGSWVRVTGQPAGAGRFRVSGVRLLRDADGDLETRRQALMVDPAKPPLPRKVAVVLLNFQNDVREPATVDMVKQYIFGAMDSTKDFVLDESFGLAVLEGKADPAGGDVFGWYTIPIDNTNCTASAWGNAAIAEAQKAGVSITGYDHYIFMWPSVRACRFGGLGEQPGRRTWMNGVSRTVTDHELGHNFSHYHSSSLTCTTDGMRATLGAACTSSEYGNPYDIMGSGGARHTNVYNKQRSGWVSAEQVQNVTTDGTYAVLPLEIPSTGVQALRVPFDATYSLWIEYRQPIGFDSRFVATDAAINGITLYLANRSRPQLLDMNPGTTTFRDATLGVGKTFQALDGRLSVTLVSMTPQAAQVKLAFAGGMAIAVDGSAIRFVDSAVPLPPEVRDAGVVPVDAAAARPTEAGVVEARGAEVALSPPADVGGAVPGPTGGDATAGPSPSPAADGPPGGPPPPATTNIDGDGGCGCALASARAPAGGGWIASAMALALALGMRRRRRT